MYETAARSYRQVNILSADPLKLVRICYEGAISNLKMARDAYIAQDYEAKGKCLLKTINVIQELNASLDMQKGGEIAVNLRALYMYMTRVLVQADLKKNLTVFDDVIRMLEELESAWQEISCDRPGNVSLPMSQGMPKAAEKTAVVSRGWSA